MGCGRKEPLTDPTLTNIFRLALRSGKCGGRIQSGEEPSSRKAIDAAFIVAIFRVYLYRSIASLTEGRHPDRPIQHVSSLIVCYCQEDAVWKNSITVGVTHPWYQTLLCRMVFPTNGIA